MATEVRGISTQTEQTDRPKEVTHFNDTVRLAKLGCQRSITQLWNEHKYLAEYIVRKYVRQDYEVDEVVSLAMTRAFAKLPIWDGTGKFSSWLSVVVKRVALSYVKERMLRRRDIVELVTNEHDQPIKEKQSDFLAERMIHDFVTKLPKHQRKIFECMAIREMTYPEAAKELGTTVGTVKSNMFEARQRLKKLCIDAGLHK